MNQGSTTSPSICGVVVLYAPLEDPIAHIEQRLEQVAHLAVIDNGDELARHAMLSAWKHPSVTYLVNDENNLAKAQNKGIAIAKARGDAFVLLLDDDSVIGDGMVARLMESFTIESFQQTSLRATQSRGNPNRNGLLRRMLSHDSSQRRLASIGLVAPQMVDAQSGRVRAFIEPWGTCLFRKAAPDASGICSNILTAIASGSLIPIKVLDDVGGMDESYGIDYVDKEFCLRLRQCGYRIIGDANAKLLHTIGHSQDKHIAGVRMVATNHSPARRFSIYRNRVTTLRRYGLKELAFVMHELLGIGYDWLRIALFEKDKKAKFCAIWNGMKAGFNSSL